MDTILTPVLISQQPPTPSKTANRKPKRMLRQGLNQLSNRKTNQLSMQEDFTTEHYVEAFRSTGIAQSQPIARTMPIVFMGSATCQHKLLRSRVSDFTTRCRWPEHTIERISNFHSQHLATGIEGTWISHTNYVPPS